jgi:uncharacterized C2H2 Zn-finger protein
VRCVALLQKTLQCPMCQKLFTSNTGFRDHVNSHKGVFRYQCPQCERGFAAKKNMLEHLAAHTGLNYFQCPKCPQKFPNHYQLSRHKVQGCDAGSVNQQQVFSPPVFPTGHVVQENDSSRNDASNENSRNESMSYENTSYGNRSYEMSNENTS